MSDITHYADADCTVGDDGCCTGTIRSAVLVGIEARPVTVEAVTRSGPPSLTIVGLSDTAARETKIRVRSALASVAFPTNQRPCTGFWFSLGELTEEPCGS